MSRKLCPKIILGFRLIFCYRSPETFAAAREERIRVSGNPLQYDNLDTFIGEQERMAMLVERSLLPSMTQDVSSNDVPKAVESIADWIERSGGLYAA